MSDKDKKIEELKKSYEELIFIFLGQKYTDYSKKLLDNFINLLTDILKGEDK